MLSFSKEVNKTCITKKNYADYIIVLFHAETPELPQEPQCKGLRGGGGGGVLINSSRDC